MVQFNLLPDIKLEYIRSQRLKRTVVGIAVIVGGASVTVLVLMFLVVNVFQKQHLIGINKDIETYNNELQAKEDLGKVLTVQNQLMSLPALHDQKPVTSRLFTYLRQIVPTKISISQLDVDFEASTITITGKTDTLNTANIFIDTLKFTTYKSAGADQEPRAFTSVVMSQFTKNNDETTYTITLNFVKDIFDSSKNVSLTVPKTITTRSETEKPDALFQEIENQQNNNQPRQ